MAEAMHTPWIVVPENEHHGFYIEDRYGDPVCDLYTMRAGMPEHIGFMPDERAAFIVECVNGRDALEAAKEAAERQYMEMHDAYMAVREANEALVEALEGLLVARIGSVKAGYAALALARGKA